ncbi:coiled-coil domain-containing protein 9-like [Paramacrobiotus metropolitanus]|uniref:coiled-coil domain-containing protein 9-like n=1 Tax=Paramacrobiotus metropolitanus TaxID=2943436 RepID=UPI0024464D50|nr:coiled-coil domain-containing protein 9-like [Paramacrobiotus metropolitanus]
MTQLAELPGPKNLPQEKPTRPSVTRRENALRKEQQEANVRAAGQRPSPRDAVSLPNAAGQSRPPSSAPSASSMKIRKTTAKKGRGKKSPTPPPDDSDPEDSRPEDSESEEDEEGEDQEDQEMASQKSDSEDSDDDDQSPGELTINVPPDHSM